MRANISSIEIEYQARIDDLLPKERIARSAAMFQWLRDVIGRQLISQQAGNGAMSGEELKWKTALRMYDGEPAIAALIRRRLEYVSR